ncbi:hypothetical protein RJT34_17635 [Clitoria ternatea]|uniref:Uncharacterized protein n=1 Tax=Clitoria ternatea TaxID=43366 RepID=A0AAN9PDB0_CLITE
MDHCRIHCKGDYPNRLGGKQKSKLGSLTPRGLFPLSTAFNSTASSSFAPPYHRARSRTTAPEKVQLSSSPFREEEVTKRISAEMVEASGNLDVEKLISYGDDLVKVLQDPRDLNNLSQCLHHTLSLSSTCDSDLNNVRSSIQEYQKKIDACKQKIEEVRSETVADADLDLLQRDLDEELEKERLLKEDNEFNDLEKHLISVQEQKKHSQKIEKEKLRTQMMLSMYASVTNIVPDLDEQSKISGYIVDKDKNIVEKFEYDTSKMTTLSVCNDIWKTIIRAFCWCNINSEIAWQNIFRVEHNLLTLDMYRNLFVLK